MVSPHLLMVMISMLLFLLSAIPFPYPERFGGINVIALGLFFFALSFMFP